MKIFLIGFMGSGKSTLGAYAARNCGLSFLDIDQLIEAREGMKVAQVFAARSEAYFRDVEHAIVKEVCALEGDYLIACGGGTPCFFDNMERMNQAGITVYLDLGSARLTDRLRHAKEERPLLKFTKGDLQLHIHRMLMERARFYSQAQVAIPEEQVNKAGVRKVVEGLMAKAAGL